MADRKFLLSIDDHGGHLLQNDRPRLPAEEVFQPHEAIKDVYEVGRTGIRQLVEKASGKKRPSYVYVNNRLEGNALRTINEALALLEGRHGEASASPGPVEKV